MPKNNMANGGTAGTEKASDTGDVRIVVKDLIYTVGSNKKKGETLTLLRDVSVFFQPREMSALMGPSGSGKTTMLDILAGRKTQGTVHGEILFSGIKPTKQFLQRKTGYVEQFDTLLPILTVYEMLLYTSEMKRDLKEPLSSKRKEVEELLCKLSLESCRNVRIGSSMSRGISGGQAKRTNIAIALITDPRVLFLDEPTSGLDSYTANEVMTVVKSLVHDGVTVVATIHSPSPYCFNLFDSLTMLISGYLVYFGPQGKTALAHFEHACQGVVARAVPEGYNDAELLVDLVTEVDRQPGGAEQLARTYKESSLCQSHEVRLQQYLDHRSSVPQDVMKQLNSTRATNTPWWWGLITLLKYRTARSFRDPEYLGPRLGDKVVIGVLILTLYWGIGESLAAENLINIVAVLFMLIVGSSFGASTYIPSIVLERGLFVRERNDGLYLVITYLLAKMVEELLLALPINLALALTCFYALQLQGSFVVFWMVLYVVSAIGIVLAYAIAAVAPTMDVANGALPVFLVLNMYFAGFLIIYDKIPVWWQWYTHINFGRYAWQAAMQNQFGAVDPIYINNMTVLDYYSLNTATPWANVGYTSLFFLVFFIAAWSALQFKTYQLR